MFEIRDGKGKVFNRVENPAIVFDRDTFTLLKIGELEEMQNYWELVTQTYHNGGFLNMVKATTLMELAHDQEEINRVFQNTGYIKHLYRKAQSAV